MQSVPTVSEQQQPTVTSSITTAPNDLLGGWSDNSSEPVNTSAESDPFGLSLNTGSTPSSDVDLFSGLRVDHIETAQSNGDHDSSSLFEGLTIGVGETTTPFKPQAPVDSLVDMMGSASTETHTKANGNSMSDPFQGLSTSGLTTELPASTTSNVNDAQSSTGISKQGSTFTQGLGSGTLDLGQLGMPPSGGGLPSQTMYMNPAVLMQMANGGFPPNMLLPQGFPGALGYGGVSPALAQQQLAASLANMQRLGMGMTMGGLAGFQGHLGSAHGLGQQTSSNSFDFSSPVGPRFTTAEPKKEDTKAFDFLKVHIITCVKLETFFGIP